MTHQRKRISDVFRTIGQPTVTYVKRDNGKLEKALNSALNEDGQLCLITGPSKTGKTTLYREVLAGRNEMPLLVQCDRETTCDDIWRKALEAIEFERIESRTSGYTRKKSLEASIEAKAGWKWLAHVTGGLRGASGKDISDSEVKARILAEPNPDLVIPVLKLTNYTLVVEDFHYLDDKEKVLLFQQWKRFIDAELSVIVLGTTHRAVDIASSNKDLIGRIAQIDVGHWAVSDLQRIVFLGFQETRSKVSMHAKQVISKEAVGLPIVVQQVCLQIFTNVDIEFVDDKRCLSFEPTSNLVAAALHNVAKLKYTQFESYYSTLIRGPREKTRKYKTYELMLACFTLDPIQFHLKRTEIDSRLGKLGLDTSETPPPASLNSTFGALKKFQERRKFALLEWQPNEEILYIIEPSFLFYVRWRKEKESSRSQLDLFEQLVSNISKLIMPKSKGVPISD